MAKKANASTPASTPPAAPRRGARRRADIPRDVLERLNRGDEPTVTLAEILAIDFAVLLRHAAPALPTRAVDEVASAGGIVPRMATAGRLIREHLGAKGAQALAAHPSDVVRGWACYAIVSGGTSSLDTRLRAIRSLADDPHSGVREWAWLALRPFIAAEVDRAIALLTPWTSHASANIRRFASEATRPRGVWCAHIIELKDDPSRGLPLLEPLRADGHKYVQDSVSNWLNDASKSDPKWVRSVCSAWKRADTSAATQRICKRALRTIDR